MCSLTTGFGDSLISKVHVSEVWSSVWTYKEVVGPLRDGAVWTEVRSLRVRLSEETYVVLVGPQLVSERGIMK